MGGGGSTARRLPPAPCGLPPAPGRPLSPDSPAIRPRVAREAAAPALGREGAPGRSPADGADRPAARREGAGRSGRGAAGGRRSRRSHVRARRRSQAVMSSAGPRRGAPRPPRPTSSGFGMLRPQRPRGDARGPGGAGAARGAGPPPPPPPAPRLRRGCARGLRAGRGGGARGGRGRLPAAECPPGRRLLSHGQRCPQPGLIRTARRARVRSHWAGAGPRAPGMTL